MFKKGASGAPFDSSSAQKEPIMRLEQSVIMESNKYIFTKNNKKKKLLLQKILLQQVNYTKDADRKLLCVPAFNIFLL